MQSPDIFYGDNYNKVEMGKSYSFTSFQILEFLTGKPWDEVALACCTAFRPTYIRVTEGIINLDARTGRITVYIDENTKLIKKITQEVQVELPEKIVSGSALKYAIEYGIDSPQCQWFNDDTIEMFSMGPDGYTKLCIDKNGKSIVVPFPED